MESKEQIDGLLTSYLSNEINTDEERFVLDWINSNEANRQYFEQLKNAWRLAPVKNEMDKIDIDYEWHRFKQALAKKQVGNIADSRLESLAGEEFEAEVPVRKISIYRVLAAVAVAASVLLIIGFSWSWLSDKNTVKQPIAGIEKVAKEKLAVTQKHNVNNTGKSKRIVLEDGSEVILWDKSELVYNEPFVGNKRDLWLTGKADFKVAKDKTKPFTVYSGDISTTALGTRFTVASFNEDDNIKIALFEGKVVIKSAENAPKKLSNDFYLLPGQELVYNRAKHTAGITKTTNNIQIADVDVKQKAVNETPSIPENKKGTWYMFNNQSLAEVFDQLSLLYNVEIVYSKKDVYKKYFIGDFAKTESIEKILKQIALVNGLKVVKENNKFILTK